MNMLTISFYLELQSVPRPSVSNQHHQSTPPAIIHPPISPLETIHERVPAETPPVTLPPTATKSSKVVGQWGGKLRNATPAQMVLINLADAYFKRNILIRQMFPEHPAAALTTEWVESALESARAATQPPISQAPLLVDKTCVNYVRTFSLAIGEIAELTYTSSVHG